MEPSLSLITPVHADDSESVGLPEVGLLVSPLVDVSSDMAVDVSRPVSPLSSVESLLLQDMLWAPVAPQSGRLSPSVHWGLDVPSGIRLTEVRIMQRYQGSSNFPCITRGSSRASLLGWEADGGWTIFRGIVLDQYTVQITFIFIDFRVCDFAFAFKTQNAPCVSLFKCVLFSDRFQFVS